MSRGCRKGERGQGQGKLKQQDNSQTRRCNRRPEVLATDVTARRVLSQGQQWLRLEGSGKPLPTKRMEPDPQG